MNDTPTLKRNRRTYFVGLNTGYVSDRAPDERMIEFYGRRSSRLLDCAIVGNVVIPGGFGTNPMTPIMSRSGQWKKLASAVASRGTVPGVQLATTWEGYVGATSFRPADWTNTIGRSRAIVGTVTKGGIDALFSSLGEATEMAAEAGFRHVQLHAAHGYLWSLLLDSRLCEEAGYCLERASRWANESRTRGLETSIRISLRTGDPDFDRAGAAEFQDAASALPVDIIDVSSGFYNIDKRLIYPSVSSLLEQRRDDR